MTPETEHLVLAAEDVASDADILRLAFKRSRVPVALTIVSDGQDAVEYLSGVAGHNDRNANLRPDLVLLDLKMPRMPGLEVLEWMGIRPQFDNMARIVLTSSSDESDVKRARELGATDFFVKPLMLDDLTQIVRTIYERWLAPRIQRSPQSERPSI